MKKRIMLNLFLDSISDQELTLLRNLKSKSIDVGEEKSTATIHDCGHDTGEPCGKVEVL